MNSNTTEFESINRIHCRFRHDAGRKTLEKLFACFVPDEYLSKYKYVVIETNGDMTYFDVLYNSDTHTAHNVELDLELVLRSLE